MVARGTPAPGSTSSTGEVATGYRVPGVFPGAELESRVGDRVKCDIAVDGSAARFR